MDAHGPVFRLLPPQPDLAVLKWKAHAAIAALVQIPEKIGNRCELIKFMNILVKPLHELMDTVREMHLAFPNMGQTRENRYEVFVRQKALYHRTSVLLADLKQYLSHSRPDDVLVSVNRLLDQVKDLVVQFERITET